MKTMFTLLGSIFLYSFSTAQKGSWYIGGNTGFSVSQNKQTSNGSTANNGKNTSWSFSPEIGSFITKNIQIGLGLTVSGSKSDNQFVSNPSINRSNLFGSTVYSRKFWGKDNFKPFAGLNISLLRGKSILESSGAKFESKQTQFSANINAGFSYALSKRVSALGSFGLLGYSSSVSRQTDNDTRYRVSSFGLDASSLGDRFNIGFYYTFHQ